MLKYLYLINECIEENVMADFLRKHRGDVMNSCLTEFSEVLFKKGVFEEGRVAGLEEASAKMHEISSKMEYLLILFEFPLKTFPMNNFAKSTRKLWLVKLNK